MATNDNIPTPEGIAQFFADPDGSKRRAAGNLPTDDLARRRLEAQAAKDAWKPPRDALWQVAHPDEGGALYLKLSPRDDWKKPRERSPRPAKMITVAIQIDHRHQPIGSSTPQH